MTRAFEPVGTIVRHVPAHFDDVFVIVHAEMRGVGTVTVPRSLRTTEGLTPFGMIRTIDERTGAG
jgi:hypothetical protein